MSLLQCSAAAIGILVGSVIFTLAVGVAAEVALVGLFGP